MASELLKLREGDGAHGLPVTPKIGRLRFEEAANDLLNEYRTNRRKSLDEVERRIEKHLAPFFGGRRMASLTTAHVREYVVKRQAETEVTFKAYGVTRKDGTSRRVPERSRTSTGASNAEINRELTILKRMFSLAIQAGKLLHKPHIPLLREDNVRTGFFEPDQFASVYAASADSHSASDRVRLHHRLANPVRGSDAAVAYTSISKRARCGSTQGRRRTATDVCSSSRTISVGS